MSGVEERALVSGEVIPHFRLPAVGGGTEDTRAYKQRLNLLIAYMDLDNCSACAEYLGRLAGSAGALHELEAKLLAVFPQRSEQVMEALGATGYPFPLLIDEDGRVGRLYLGDRTGAIGGLFVTDRYGALRESFLFAPGDELPDLDQVLARLNIIECECPE